MVREEAKEPQTMAKSPGLACSAAQQRLGLGRHLSFPSCSAAAHTAKQAGADLVGEIGLRSTLDPGLTALITTITIDRLAGRPTKSVPAAYGATICCPGFVRRCVSWKRQMSIIRRHHSAPVASDKSTNAHPGRYGCTLVDAWIGLWADRVLDCSIDCRSSFCSASYPCSSSKGFRNRLRQSLRPR